MSNTIMKNVGDYLEGKFLELKDYIDGRLRSLRIYSTQIEGVIDTDHLPEASTTQQGVVQLDNTTTSTSTVKAPTANVAKLLWDRISQIELGGGVVTETDPIVGAISGIVKADGNGNISAAQLGTDYTPAYNLLNMNLWQENTSYNPGDFVLLPYGEGGTNSIWIFAYCITAHTSSSTLIYEDEQASSNWVIVNMISPIMFSIGYIDGIIKGDQGSISAAVAGTDYMAPPLTGEKSSSVDAGTFGQMSITDDYIYVCTQTGIAGNAIWKKALMFAT